MISRLTSEMESDIRRERESWIQRYSSSAYDHERIRDCIVKLYEDLDLQSPEVLIAKSLLDASLLTHSLRTDRARLSDLSELEIAIPNQDELVSLRSFIWEEIGERFGVMSRELSRSISTELRGKIKAQLWDPIDSIGSFSMAPILNQALKKEISNYSLRPLEPCHHVGIGDYGLTAFFSFCADQGWCDFSPLQSLLDALSSGVYCILPFEKLCVFAPMPEHTQLNEAYQISSGEGKAVAWNDGFGAYVWNGYKTSERIIMRPESLTKKDILLETNAERRRILHERLGSERFAALLELHILDEDIDAQGHIQQLFRTKERDNIIGEYLYFARVICPTTQRVYFLSVPPGLGNVWDAVAWTFGRTKETYKPQIQS